LEGVNRLPLNLSPQSELLADSAYIDYVTEEMMADQ
jgi:hypothetical protein